MYRAQISHVIRSLLFLPLAVWGVACDPTPDNPAARDVQTPHPQDSQPAAPREPTPADPNDAAATHPPDPPPQLTAEQKQEMRQRGHTMYQQSCMQCHQLHGTGQRHMAPTLIDSPFVLGDEDHLVLLILDGIKDGGDQPWSIQMPATRGAAVMNDERLAALVHYLRHAWGHETDSDMHPDRVAEIRDATGDRAQPWTPAELEAFSLDK